MLSVSLLLGALHFGSISAAHAQNQTDEIQAQQQVPRKRITQEYSIWLPQYLLTDNDISSITLNFWTRVTFDKKIHDIVTEALDALEKKVKVKSE